MRHWLESQGIIFGTYRWGTSGESGPPPLVGSIRGRSFYLSWGHR